MKWQVDLTFLPAKYNARNVAATVLHIPPSHRKLFHMLAPIFPINVLSQDTFTDRTRPDSNEFKPFLTKSIKNYDAIVIGIQVWVDMTSHVCRHSVETYRPHAVIGRYDIWRLLCRSACDVTIELMQIGVAI